MTNTLIAHREKERQAIIDRGGPDLGTKSLLVWTSTRRRTIETSQFFSEEGYQVRQRSQMGQLNPGVCEKMSERSIREQMPEEVAKHEADPYHHRYPRAEVSFVFEITSPFFRHTLHIIFSAKQYINSHESHTTTSPSASNPSSSSSNANRTTSSSSPTTPSCVSSTATSWPATPSRSPCSSSLATKFLRLSPQVIVMRRR